MAISGGGCLLPFALRLIFTGKIKDCTTNIYRLRQTDVKAGHFERKVQALEQDRDQWAAKFEEMAKKYAASQKELEDFQAEIGNI